MQDDMDVMFDNAMAYNSADTVYHKQARSLKAVAAKMVELAKQGVTDFRLEAWSLLKFLLSHVHGVALQEQSRLH